MPSAHNITVFDTQIQRYHALFVLPFDWRLLKAQLIAESGLNPDAKSPAGALGLAQFMPDTWAQVLADLHLPGGTSPFNAEASIKCYAYYLATLIKQWSAPRPEIDRYCLALASYNAGLGHVLKAQKLAGGSNAYHAIIAELHRVTGADDAPETIHYAARILSAWQRMIVEG